MVASGGSRLTRRSSILVVGAGPAGLALALQAHDHGADVRIIERRPEAFRPSRALIMHPRTLEVLGPLGVTSALLERADIMPRACLHVGRRVADVKLGDFALPDTAFPHLSLVRQMDVETVLAQALADRGVPVEFGSALAGLSGGPPGARAVLRSLAGADEEAPFRFVVGCDGPDSTVRAESGIGWRGGPYPVEALLADAELAVGDRAGDPAGALSAGSLHVAAGPHGLVFLFARGERATWRLLATRSARPGRQPFGQAGPPVEAAELQALLDETEIGARITGLAWSARVRLQHRLADRFRQGSLFLAGDAAHAYSPATGQGMNIGIQDAVNLGWKLAFAGSALDPAVLLDSYERERRPVARHVLAMTHLAFWGEASTGRLPSVLRGALLPLAVPVLPALMSRRHLVARGVRIMSQLRTGYPRSPLSVEAAPRQRGRPRAGHRLPDETVVCAGRRVRLHELLARPGVHILLQRDADQIGSLPPGSNAHVHRLTSAPGRGLLAVRPDGHVGFRCREVDAAQLRAWLARVGAI